MDKSLKFGEQTRTSFYDPINKSKGSQEFPIYQPMKSNFPQLILAIEEMNDRTSILQMEEEINQIRRKLRIVEENIKKISSVEDLKAIVEKMQEELGSARQKYLQHSAEVKAEITDLLSSLEKQLQNFKKEWEKLRLKCQQQLAEQVNEIRAQKALNETLLTQLLKSANAGIKEDMNLFSQELKQSRKNRNLRSQKLFAQLDSVRENLGALIVQEEAKRTQYDNIVYGLLDRTCENAGSALRRRVY